jgi:hypothetical protein
VDYKHGIGVPVDPFNNPQLMIYALGVVRKYGATGDDTVDMYVVQPRADASITGKPHWRCFTLTAAELEEWAERVLIPAAKATEDPDAPLCSGHHCRFCDAAPVCPELSKKACEAAKIAFADDGLPIEASPVLPAPKDLPRPQLARALDLAGIVEPWIKAVREYASELLRSGEEVPGWKLVATKGNRKWADPQEAETTLRDLAYVGLDVCDHKIKTVAQMEKALKAIGEDPKSVLEGLWTRPEGVTIAPASDPREPAKLPAAKVFEATAGEYDL